MRSVAIALAMAALVPAMSASAQRRTEAVTYDATHRSELIIRYVTRDGDDPYVVSNPRATLRVSAPSTNESTPRGSDTRALIWPPSTRATRNHQSCATWTKATGAEAQQGLALRVRMDGDRLRTITVAKNILFGANWQMNVYTWDSDRTPYLRTHGAISLEAAFATDQVPRDLPWRICARVDGRRVRVKGWNAAEDEPSWTDVWHSGSVLVPQEFSYPGRAGWYAGHVDPGTSIAMRDIETVTRNAPRRS